MQTKYMIHFCEDIFFRALFSGMHPKGERERPREWSQRLGGKASRPRRSLIHSKLLTITNGRGRCFVIALSPISVTHVRTDGTGHTRISDRFVFVCPLAEAVFFTTASKPIRNTKNLAMQVEKTRFRFQKVLAKYDCRQWDSARASFVRVWKWPLFTVRFRWMEAAK